MSKYCYISKNVSKKLFSLTNSLTMKSIFLLKIKIYFSMKYHGEFFFFTAPNSTNELFSVEICE